MPKTFTNDIAPVLPAAVDGPFLVADPNDANAYFKVDPANGELAVAGDARPLRRRHLSLSKTTGTSVSGTIGTGMVCRQIAAGNNGGFFTSTMAIPDDMDVSEPSSVLVLVAAAVSSTLSSVAIRLEVVAGYAKDAQASPHSTTVTHDLAVPDYWQANATEVALVDDGSGRTFAPNTFETGDFLGLRMQLVRSAAADTFDKDAKLATGVVFEYTAKRL